LTLSSVMPIEPVFGETYAGRLVFAGAVLADGMTIEKVRAFGPDVGALDGELAGDAGTIDVPPPPPHALNAAIATIAIHRLVIGESPP
jgi:hypothetical protein